MRFKVGDKVQLKPNLTEGQYGPVWFSEDLKELSPTKIEKICNDDSYITEDGYAVTDEMIEHAEESASELLGRIYQKTHEIIEPMIKDSGERRQFSSGAVRDVQEGKGRADLLPLIECSDWTEYGELEAIDNFMKTRKTKWIYFALDNFICRPESGFSEMHKEEVLIEVSKHFEEGAKKYDERNWEKGIPLHNYIDSGIRHFLKCMAGWTDEPHNRAFVWNMLCLLWTLRNHPELDDLPAKAYKKSPIGEWLKAPKTKWLRSEESEE